jgi:hypothetical protein
MPRSPLSSTAILLKLVGAGGLHSVEGARVLLGISLTACAEALEVAATLEIVISDLLDW